MLSWDAFGAFFFSLRQRECDTPTVVLLECVIPPAAGMMMGCRCGDAAEAVLSMLTFCLLLLLQSELTAWHNYTVKQKQYEKNCNICQTCCRWKTRHVSIGNSAFYSWSSANKSLFEKVLFGQTDRRWFVFISGYCSIGNNHINKSQHAKLETAAVLLLHICSRQLYPAKWTRTSLLQRPHRQHWQTFNATNKVSMKQVRSRSWISVWSDVGQADHGTSERFLQWWKLLRLEFALIGRQVMHFWFQNTHARLLHRR